MHSACVEKSEKVESEEIFLRLNSKNLRILGVFQVVNCRTFASPWGNEDTQTLIDILARYGVKTTFFVVGDWAEKYPESVKALHDAGHGEYDDHVIAAIRSMGMEPIQWDVEQPEMT